MKKNYFSILGISKSASDDDVRQGYRSMAKKYHPDKNPDPKATEIFKEIGEAYEKLKSQDSREIYLREIQKTQETPETPTKTSATASSSTPNTSSTSNTSSSQRSHHKKSTFDFRNSYPNASEKSQSQESKKDSKGKENKKSEAKPSAKEKHKNPPKKKTKPHAEPKKQFKFSRQFTFMNSDYKNEHFPFSFTNPNEFDVFLNNTDLFETWFSPGFSFDSDIGSRSLGRSGSRNSRPSTGPSTSKTRPKSGIFTSKDDTEDGLDSDMYNWGKPLFSNYWNRDQTGLDYYDDNNDDHDRESIFGKKFKCSFCCKMFPSSAIQKHEDDCGKFRSSTPEDYPGYYSPRPSRKPWREEHEDLLHHVQQAKRNSNSNFKSPSPNKANNGVFMYCPWCEKSFNTYTESDHAFTCPVKISTQKHGTPNTSKGRFHKAKLDIGGKFKAQAKFTSTEKS